MFRNGQTIYCKNEIVAKKLREYAKKLNKEHDSNTDFKIQEKEQDVPIVPNTGVEPDEIRKIELKYPGLAHKVATTQEFALFPPFLLDVMNGGTYPNMEDLTREEQRILYDPTINSLVNQYRAKRTFITALQIKVRLIELGVDF